MDYAETWIIAALRDRKFFTVQEAQEATAEKLEEFNTREFRVRTGCRRSAYLEEEKAYITFMGNKCETWQDMRLVTELANDIYVNGVRICRRMKF